jgi:hypothetical protein
VKLRRRLLDADEAAIATATDRLAGHRQGG